LGITLDEKLQIELFVNHRIEKLFHLWIFIEIVRRKHNHLDAGSLCSSETLDCGLNALAANSATRNLDHGAIVTGEGAAARRIKSEHRYNVTLQILRRRRVNNRGFKLSLPALRLPVNGL
jgi:hypothetical protein